MAPPASANALSRAQEAAEEFKRDRITAADLDQRKARANKLAAEHKGLPLLASLNNARRTPDEKAKALAAAEAEERLAKKALEKLLDDIEATFDEPPGSAPPPKKDV